MQTSELLFSLLFSSTRFLNGETFNLSMAEFIYPQTRQNNEPEWSIINYKCYRTCFFFSSFYPLSFLFPTWSHILDVIYRCSYEPCVCVFYSCLVINYVSLVIVERESGRTCWSDVQFPSVLLVETIRSSELPRQATRAKTKKILLVLCCLVDAFRFSSFLSFPLFSLCASGRSLVSASISRILLMPFD